MLQAVVAEQKEWKEEKKNQSVPFPYRSILIKQGRNTTLSLHFCFEN